MNKHQLAPLLALSLFAANAMSPREAGRAAVLGGDFAWTHDPSRIVKSGAKYFLYLTGENIPMKYSGDLVTWKKGPAVLAKIPDWARQAVPAAKSDFAWAPDVILVDGKYLLFWSFSTFGSKVSVTGLLSNSTLDPEAPGYAWKDEGLVLASTQRSDFNAIDPAPILTQAGELWLALGSWNRGGIKMLRLDRKTGKPVSEPITVAAGQSNGPEAPYVHERNGWFYLFENEGTCCAGMNSGYTIRVGRAKSISGPFLDREGRDLSKGGGTLFMGTEGEVIGPGHVGIYSEGELDRLTFHFYDSRANGVPTLGMRALGWSADGWPSIAEDLPGGRYVISSQASGLALGIFNNKAEDGTPIDQFEYRGGATQQWNVSPVGDGLYAIGSLGTGKYLDVFECSTADGAKISQYPWMNNDCQKWRIEPLGDGSFRVISKGSGTALTLPGGTKSPQALTQARGWRGEAGQKWRFKRLPETAGPA